MRRLLLEGYGGVGFVDRDRDAADERPVHPDMRLKVATGVHHRDVHGLPDLLGLPRGGVDDPSSFLQRYGLLRLRGLRHNLPFPSLSVYMLVLEPLRRDLAQHTLARFQTHGSILLTSFGTQPTLVPIPA